MTPSELKHLYEQAEPDGHFFDRKTLSFFGDTMRNYGVRKASVKVLSDTTGADGQYIPETVEAWELYRKRPVKHGLKKSHFFSMSGEQLHPID